MKVLSPGHLSNDWKDVVKCTYCGAKLEICRDDLFVKFNIIGREIFVTCMCCKKDFCIQSWVDYTWGKLPTKEERQAKIKNEGGE